MGAITANTAANKSRTKKSDNRSAPALLTAAGFALSLSAPAHAVDWKITPGVNVVESYTDNIRLAPHGSEQSDYVTEVVPKVQVKATSRRLNASLDYEVQNFAYGKTSGKVSTSQHLDAKATAELTQDFLFFDAAANISQQTGSPFGPYATSNLNITNNLAEVRTASVSPYFKHKFGSTLTSELRYTNSEVTSDAAGFLSSHADNVLLNVTSGEAFHALPWGLQYSYQKTNYRGGTPLTSQSGSANVHYPVTPRFSLTATAGHESNDYLSTGTNPSGPFWSGGFIWNPSERTKLTATAGHRFFGTTHSLAFNLRSRTTVWNVNYSEDITTARSQFLVPATIDTSAFLNDLWKSSIPDPALRQTTVDNFIQNGGLPSSLASSMNLLTNRIFLQKTWQASVAVNGARNSLLFSAMDSTHDAQSPAGVDATLLAGNTALQDSTHQSSLSVLWNRRLSTRTDLNVSTTYSKIHSLATDTKSTVRNDSIAMTRQLQPKVKGSVEWRHVHQVSGALAGPIDENVVAATLQVGF